MQKVSYVSAGVDFATLSATIELLRTCFPKASHYNRPYLDWLYCSNPCGPALGINAYDEKVLVGHFVGIPQRVRLKQRDETVLLLLNIATHPGYRGRGLFIEAIQRVMKAAVDKGYAAITGVANAQTYRGYEKLGFQNVAGLDAEIGIGVPKLDAMRSLEYAEFSRLWDDATLMWRMGNPANPLWVSSSTHDQIRIDGLTSLPGVKARGVIAKRGIEVVPAEHSRGKFRPHVLVGLQPSGTLAHLGMSIPHLLRPSPLRFIYMNLVDPNDRLDKNSISFTFLDFDAF